MPPTAQDVSDKPRITHAYTHTSVVQGAAWANPAATRGGEDTLLPCSPGAEWLLHSILFPPHEDCDSSWNSLKLLSELRHQTRAGWKQWGARKEMRFWQGLSWMVFHARLSEWKPHVGNSPPRASVGSPTVGIRHPEMQQPGSSPLEWWASRSSQPSSQDSWSRGRNTERQLLPGVVQSWGKGGWRLVISLLSTLPARLTLKYCVQVGRQRFENLRDSPEKQKQLTMRHVQSSLGFTYKGDWVARQLYLTSFAEWKCRIPEGCPI